MIRDPVAGSAGLKPASWPVGASSTDVVIVREETANGPSFVVHTRNGPQLACRTFVEAERTALTHVEGSWGHAWFTDGYEMRLLFADGR
jgi:hypothetical protein